MRKVLYIALVFLLGLGLMVNFYSCEIENSKQVTVEEAIQAINESAQASAFFKDAFNEASDAAKYADDSLSGRFVKGQFNADDEPEITITPYDTDTWPKTITIDYGSENMPCADMRDRRGIIQVVASDYFFNEGCELDISFDEFYQNDYKMDGNMLVQYEGDNELGHRIYNVNVTNGILTSPDNKLFHFEQNTQREWIEGIESPNPWDDIHLIRGSQNGISSDSVPYSLNINDSVPLNVLIGCRWIRAGIIDIEIESLPDMQLDYGEGVCDNAATITIYGDEYLINMQ